MSLLTWKEVLPTQWRGCLSFDPSTPLFIAEETTRKSGPWSGSCVRLLGALNSNDEEKKEYDNLESAKAAAEQRLRDWVRRAGERLVDQVEFEGGASYRPELVVIEKDLLYAARNGLCMAQGYLSGYQVKGDSYLDKKVAEVVANDLRHIEATLKQLREIGGVQ